MDNINGKTSLIIKKIWVFSTITGSFPFIFNISKENPLFTKGRAF